MTCLRFKNYSGDDLLSHTVSRAVPSAQVGLTSEFGMGSGVAPPAMPPENEDATNTFSQFKRPGSRAGSFEQVRASWFFAFATTATRAGSAPCHFSSCVAIFCSERSLRSKPGRIPARHSARDRSS